MAGPVSPNRHIHFYGQDFYTAAKNHAFDVLAGDKPPRIVDGYGIWQMIKLPLRRALTTFEGYNPITMEVSVRFLQMGADGSWLTDDGTGAAIEERIKKLEWMGGNNIIVGPPPFVWLSTFDGQGNTTPLIPWAYQSPTANEQQFLGATLNASFSVNLAWIVKSIVWDENPIRNTGGFRIRQDATVTVQLYNGPAGTPNSGTARTRAVTFISRTGADTCLLIARQLPTAFPAALAGNMRTAPQNKNLHLRSVNQKIKHGKKVYIPAGN